MLFIRMSERAEPGGDAEPYTITLRSAPFHEQYHYRTVYQQDISLSTTRKHAVLTNFESCQITML
jgi:hypothetical protein